MQLISETEPIIAEETVNSIRFNGDIVYISTDRADFTAVDIADPDHPLYRVETHGYPCNLYLHNDKLFGFGKNPYQIQLSMFQANNPYTLEMENRYILETIHTEDFDMVYNSEATENYMAVFNSGENNIIGFPVRTFYRVKIDDFYNSIAYEVNYFIFEYTDTAFKCRKKLLFTDTLHVPNAYDTAIRPFQIGDYLYVVSQHLGIYILDSDTMQEVGKIEFQ